MAPLWVTFDSIALYNGSCANGADPDIAGLGVVLSFVIASAMATAASILAMILDQAYDSKGHFKARAPLKYLRERFLDTGWKRDYAWRPFLDPLIIGLGDQQLITGYAVGQDDIQVQGAHFVLILYVCALSSSSHLAALITLRKYFRRYKLIARIRIAVFILFALFLLSSMMAAIAMPSTMIDYDDGTQESPSRAKRLSFLVPLFLILVGFSTALVCILYDPKDEVKRSRASDTSGSVRRATDPNQNTLQPSLRNPAHVGLRLVRFLFLNPLIAFLVQILLAILSAILVLSQKFSRPNDVEKFCGLQDGGENLWGFGQTLSVAMLLLPGMSACQTYLEGHQEIKEAFTWSKDQGRDR
ncbi:pre-rRNA-processing protein esf1 [Pleosporales sp. CAS-2024a]